MFLKDPPGSHVENEHGEVARVEVWKPVRRFFQPPRQAMLLAKTTVTADKEERYLDEPDIK